MAAAGAQRKLDPSLNSQATKLLIQQFSRKVVGQAKAVQTMVDILENYHLLYLSSILRKYSHLGLYSNQ